eukprot:1390409-Amphidinium_carterae.1
MSAPQMSFAQVLRGSVRSLELLTGGKGLGSLFGTRAMSFPAQHSTLGGTCHVVMTPPKNSKGGKHERP